MAKSVRHGIRQPWKCNALVAESAQQRVLIPVPTEVAAYLDLHADLAAVLPSICAQARQEFGEKAELKLGIYRDPEIDDHYLTLRVRLPVYDDAIMTRIDSVTQPFDEELCQASGTLLVTTDFVRLANADIVCPDAGG